MATEQAADGERAPRAPGVSGVSGVSGGADEATPAPEGEELTVDDLRRMVGVLGLIEIPEALLPRVLEHVRAHRAAMRTFAAAGIELGDVVTAQPFRA